MIQKLVGEIFLDIDLQDVWPEKTLTAEAHLGGNEGEGPWSMRANFWSSPDENGRVFAWISFLSPEAPFAGYPLRESFCLTLGGRIVARCVIHVQPQYEVPYEENDFINNPNKPVRKAA